MDGKRHLYFLTRHHLITILFGYKCFYDQMIDLAYENKMLREENKQLKQVTGSLNQDNELLRRREKRFEHMRELCPEESQKLQESYKNRVREIEEKRKQEEEIKKQQALVEKQEREKRLQEAVARRPKGESAMDNNPEPKPQPKPEQQPQAARCSHAATVGLALDRMG